MSTSVGLGPLTEQTFEIRYKPNAKILDYRGTWAEELSERLGLTEWLVRNNRVDVFNTDQSERVFVGFRNAGYHCLTAPTANYFGDKGVKFLKFLLSFESFGDPVFVERFGVRSRFVTSYPDFDDLKERIATRYITIPDRAMNAIGSATLTDLGIQLNFKDQLGNSNTMIGPMHEDQIRDYMENREAYPEVGLYYDIDYWFQPKKPVGGPELVRLIKSFATETWNRHDKIRDLIFGD